MLAAMLHIQKKIPPCVLGPQYDERGKEKEDELRKHSGEGDCETGKK